MSRSDFMATTACYMLRVAGLKQLNWASEGVGATAAALVDLSTVAGNKISNPPWVKFQSAGWVNFPSAPTQVIPTRRIPQVCKASHRVVEWRTKSAFYSK
ncbi:hypothetical protein I5S53_25910 [Pseudomonas juntendi]|uniref:hypothetical protein n=1 Tax=Pseudomonadaceae TaxID=135621 RepID=UPI0018D85AD5|nr:MULTISPECIES: hypothetical protein [Pseudomonadaceae]MBH3387385.1 hypothetical protein [Pseudomonas juntendi]QXP23920.1 hypothetical protein KVH38_11085 [Stutzerimonas stutzeri]QXP27976.1 hypothetical protein KVH38_21235 [Stutzerimonas stutzeri]